MPEPEHPVLLSARRVAARNLQLETNITASSSARTGNVARTHHKPEIPSKPLDLPGMVHCTPRSQRPELSEFIARIMVVGLGGGRFYSTSGKGLNVTRGLGFIG